MLGNGFVVWPNQFQARTESRNIGQCFSIHFILRIFVPHNFIVKYSERRKAYPELELNAFTAFSDDYSNYRSLKEINSWVPLKTEADYA